MRYIFQVFLLIACYSINNVQASFLNPQSLTLKNGMRVILVEYHRTPVVYHSVWYRVGSADEDPSKPRGLAHFCEHMMFKGTKQHPKGSFSQTLQDIGGHYNAFTSFDFTAYYALAGVEHLETLMTLEADRMLNLQISTSDVATELNVVAEERRMRCENLHEAQLREKSLSCLFTHHPYRTPVIGWLHDIQNYTPEVVRAFYKKWYHPANATLIVIGDVTMDQLKPLAEKHFGSLPSAPPCARVRLQEPPGHQASMDITRISDQTQLPQLTLYWQAPTIDTMASLKKAAALEVLCKSFGVGRTSRLYRSLVDRQKLASAVQVGYMNLRDHGAVFASLVPNPGVSIEVLRQAFDQELAQLKTHPVTQEELARAQKRVLGGLDYIRDSIETTAYLLGCFVASDIAPSILEAWPEALEKVTLKDLEEAVDVLFKPVLTSTLKPIQKADTEGAKQNASEKA